MIKARPVAGDLALRRRFLAAIRPFIWRRGLDFAAIADIHAMKRRIDDASDGLGSGAESRLAGHDLKLGQGGIREIEFVAQTLQLVWGGRDPALRGPHDAGRAARAGPRRAPRPARGRRAGRRLSLPAPGRAPAADGGRPADPCLPAQAGASSQRFAVFMGYADADALRGAALARHLDRVRRALRRGVRGGAGAAAPSGTLDLSGIDDPPATVAALRPRLRQCCRHDRRAARLAAGRLRALRSRARARLMDCCRRCSPRSARSPTRTPPSAASTQMLSRLPAGVQLLSLFQRNPALLDRVAAVLGAAPVARRPPGHACRPRSRACSRRRRRRRRPAQPGRAGCADARALEDAIAITRALVRAEEFRLSVGQMEGRLDVDAAGEAPHRPGRRRAGRAAAACWPTTQRATARCAAAAWRWWRSARPAAGEMMAGSDLDLMLIYDHPPDVTESHGPPARCRPASGSSAPRTPSSPR